MKNPLQGFNILFFFFFVITSSLSAAENSTSVATNFSIVVEETIVITHTSQSISLSQGTVGYLSNYISTSGGPTDVYLNAVSANETTTWLYLDNKNLKEQRFSSGSEITFEIRASGLAPGSYTSTVSITAPGHASTQLVISLEVVGTSVLNTSIQVNFQDQATVPPSGWLKDYGLAYGPKDTYEYGWKKLSDGTLLDFTANGRKRAEPADVLLATFMHMQGNSITGFTGNKNEGFWEIAVPNGNYKVTVSVGEGGTAIDSEHSINVEGVSAISKFIPTSTNKFKSAEITVSVSDGKLTLDAIGGFNTKINSVAIATSTESRPSVSSTNPTNNAVNVETNVSISTAILELPNGGIDNATLSSTTVYLEELPAFTKVPANVNGTGGGDVITLVPTSPLKANTSYKFTITSGVKDLSGASFIPYSMEFTTGTGSVVEVQDIQFSHIKQPTTDNVKHTSLVIGPDEKLWATTIDGQIRKYPIATDGTLGTPEIFSLKNLYGNTENRAIIGLVFDPQATASNPIIYITHTPFIFEQAPNFTSKITKLSGANLQTVQDIVINLPRSTKDHLTNSLAFGPDGALYFPQGSNSAMGAADRTWNLRAENLLSGAVLRLDLTKLSSLPLDVLTPEAGGTYDPYAANAPLTLYATGVRNAYDLVWHSNGQLYVPTNGSGAGGNSPASVQGTLRPDGTTYNGPAVPALNNIQQVLPDLLFRIEKGGYYGHPNPVRGEYALFGANPTSGNDPAQIDAYPVGTQPDANYKGFIYDFGLNKSSNGVIEYKSNSFNGALKGSLIVTRFSQNKDLITLKTGSNFEITNAIEGLAIPGFSGFVDPLDLIEDTRNGNIYVSEYARSEATKGNITLLRPSEKSNISASVKELIFSGVKSAVSSSKPVTLKNNGTSSVTITNLAFEGNQNTSFELVNAPSLPVTLEPQAVINLEVVFKPSGLVGPLESQLKVFTNGNTIADIGVGVYGLSTNGLEGNNEPPLNDIVKTLGYQINVGGTALSLSTGDALIGDEVYAQLFQKVGAGNVEVVPVARYSPQESLPFGYYIKQGESVELTQVGILSSDAPQHQTLFPAMQSGNNFFNPGEKYFGLFTKSTNGTHITYTENDLNAGNGANNSIKHLVRVYPLKDRKGNVINNSYLVGFEEATNGDYQDYVFVIKNVRPAPALAPTINIVSNPAAIPMNSGQQIINLSGITAGEGESQTITITAASSNTAVIPNPTVQYQSPANTAVLTYTPIAGASGVAEITITVVDNGPDTGVHKNTTVQTIRIVVNGPNNNAPTLDPIESPDPINQDSPEQVVTLTGISAGEGEQDQTITVTATSNNPELIPDPVVTYTSPNSTATLKYTPVAGAFGTATITVTVEDSGLSDAANTNNITQSFVVTVIHVNAPPTISNIPDQHVDINQVVGPVTFTINDEDSNVADLELEAVSDNQTLIPDANITFGGSGTERTITINPANEESGEALITIYVSDGYITSETTFTVYVGPNTSIDEENTKNKLVIYPNPASSEIEILIENKYIGSLDLGILDLSGRIHKSVYIDKQQEVLKANLQIDTLPKGVYIIRINQNGMLTTKRLIKL